MPNAHIKGQIVFSGEAALICPAACGAFECLVRNLDHTRLDRIQLKSQSHLNQ